MSGPLSWQDTMKATALAALAERTSPTTPKTWDPHEVWLSRIQRSRDAGMRRLPNTGALNVAPRR